MFDRIKLDVYGRSHDECIGVRVCGLDGIKFEKSVVESMLLRRRGGVLGRTDRVEGDKPQYLGYVQFDNNVGQISGDFDVRIYNNDVKKPSAEISIPRPSHADLVAFKRYGKIESGGGEFSGRMTAPLCVVGGIAKSHLESNGIKVYAYLSQVGKIDCGSYLDSNVSLNGLDCKQIERLSCDTLPIFDESKREEVESLLREVSDAGDSVGGVVECIVSGVKIGDIGGSILSGLEGKIANAVYSIPAVKGVEFGGGFALCKMFGSDANDEILSLDGRCEKNNSGGISGGISNGMPITLRVAIKPTPSIAIEQDSIDVYTGKKVKCATTSRNDACIAIRGCAVVESMVAIAILDEVLKMQNNDLNIAKCDDKVAVLQNINSNDALQIARQNINDIDKEIAKLIDKRFDIVKDVADYKAKNNIAVFDEKRENVVLDNVVKCVSKEHKDAVVEVYKIILKESKLSQEAILKKD